MTENTNSEDSAAFADQRAHDVAWMTAAERNEEDSAAFTADMGPAYEDGYSAGEPWCNHDPVAVVNGICECGVLVCEHASRDIVTTMAGADYLTCEDCGAQLRGPLPGDWA